MKRNRLFVGTVLLTLTVSPAAARAEGNSPVRDQPRVDGAHTHHVHTGSGCVDIDAVFFIPAHHGLHQGSNASSFQNPNDPDPTRGPFHGTCDERVFPGGPFLEDLGFESHH